MINFMNEVKRNISKLENVFRQSTASYLDVRWQALIFMLFSLLKVMDFDYDKFILCLMAIEKPINRMLANYCGNLHYFRVYPRHGAWHG